MPNQLTRMAKELLMIEGDFPYRLDYSKERPQINDFELYTFSQTWGSTALGFDGIGGQAMTSARTYVLVPQNCNQNCFVYFAGRFAYAVSYSPEFMNDVLAGRVEPVYRKEKYAEG